MKITFIGTSHGVPGVDRFCSCAMIEVGKSIYFVDAGAPIAEALIQRELLANNVKAVFTTHAHGDHVGYLFPFASLVNWYYKDSSIIFHLTEKAFADALSNMVLVCDAAPLDQRHEIRVVDKDYVYDDGILRASFIPTKHMAHSGTRPSYAILIEAEGKSVMFTGDLSMRLELNDYPQYIKDNEVDAVICELAHFTVDQIKPHLEQTKTKAFYFQHVYPLEKYGDVAKINGTLPYPIYSPIDNDVIEL